MGKWIYEVIASSVDIARSCACRLLDVSESPIHENREKGGFGTVVENYEEVEIF